MDSKFKVHVLNDTVLGQNLWDQESQSVPTVPKMGGNERELHGKVEIIISRF